MYLASSTTPPSHIKAKAAGKAGPTETSQAAVFLTMPSPGVAVALLAGAETENQLLETETAINCLTLPCQVVTS